ncbi:MAG: hypothetical protein RBU30_15830 [Polyangia bacterium]|jgi:hypothetical protein|nr:hypothetical protein [Polyangia bacterium]
MMARETLKSVGKVLAMLSLTLLMGSLGCGDKKVGEGKRCQNQGQCKDGLKCVNNLCTDFSGKDPACQWSLGCLRKLSEKYKTNPSYGYEILRWHKGLSGAPYKQDCKFMPEKIAALLNKEPHVWKEICGAPPVEGVKQITNKSNPFRINDSQIKDSVVPKEESAEINLKHQAYPDICKAWVDFTLTRDFQGWVIAKVYEQYDCDEETYKKRQKDPTVKPKCQKKIYTRDDRRYIYLHKAGSKFSMNFYFSTPPEVCKKPNLSEKTYNTGCFCMGIDDEKVELEWVDDPFLYQEEAMEGKKR